jgi:hypothetical protein
MLSGVAFRAAVLTTVYAVVVLACFLNSRLRGVKLAQVDSVRCVRQPCAICTMYLMLASPLLILINIELHWLVLLSLKVQAHIDIPENI